MVNLKFLQWFTGLLGFGLLVLTLPNLITKPFTEFKMPQIALEWERDPWKMNELIKEKEDKDESILKDLNFDTFVFIPTYIILFTLLASHIKTSGLNAGNKYFYAILVCALIAGISDWFENYYIHQAVNSGASAQFVEYKYYACVIKWGLIALATFLISMAFLALGKPWVALTGFAAATVFAIGIIFNPLLVQWGFSLLGAALIMIALFL